MSSVFPRSLRRVPFVRNYFRNERLYKRLSAYLADVISDERIDLIHAQHVLTGPASVRAAQRAGIPSICTVRDYWPLCYWGDVLADPGAGIVCPGCSASAMTRCLRPRAGAAWPAALPVIPYMRANLRRKQASLADADAIVAVSEYVGTALARARSGVAGGRESRRFRTASMCPDCAAMPQRRHAPASERYAVFVGKLAKNKGAHALVEIAERARLDMPLVVIGDGPERGSIEAAPRKRPGATSGFWGGGIGVRCSDGCATRSS